MNLSLSEEQQSEMRYAFLDGAPGILVSGCVWLAAAFVCHLVGVKQGVWALLAGGALIHPLGVVLTKMMGRPGTASKGNALNQLVIASTIWLVLCCALSYGLFLLKPALFFPAMMATIGSRYLVFASVFGKGVFWVIGGSLIVAGNLAFFLTLPAPIAAGLGGLLEVLFAGAVFSKAFRTAAQHKAGLNQ